MRRPRRQRCASGRGCSGLGTSLVCTSYMTDLLPLRRLTMIRTSSRRAECSVSAVAQLPAMRCAAISGLEREDGGDLGQRDVEPAKVGDKAGRLELIHPIEAVTGGRRRLAQGSAVPSRHRDGAPSATDGKVSANSPMLNCSIPPLCGLPQGEGQAREAMSYGSRRSLRRISRSATSPVHPVWCDAPSPLPFSAWKYSWNGTRSARSGRS